MDANLIDATFVRRAAAAVDLELRPEHVPGVVAYFRMIADLASLVNEFPLDAYTENASIFLPCSVPTPD